MKLFERAARRTTLGVLLLLLKEIKRLASAVEHLTDSFRIVHGHQPMFHADVPRSAVDDNRTLPRGPDLDEPDWLKIDILESLCKEHHIAITDGLDLMAVGREQGWIDEGGQIVMLPAHYGE